MAEISLFPVHAGWASTLAPLTWFLLLYFSPCVDVSSLPVTASATCPPPGAARLFIGLDELRLEVDGAEFDALHLHEQGILDVEGIRPRLAGLRPKPPHRRALWLHAADRVPLAEYLQVADLARGLGYEVHADFDREICPAPQTPLRL